MMSRRIYISVVMLGLTIAVVSFSLLDGLAALVSCLLGWVLLAIAIIDARHYIIPDILSLPAIPAGLIATYFLTHNPEPYSVLLEHVLALILAGGCFYIIRLVYRQYRGRQGLGLGDVKLMIAAGAWTGLLGISYVILLASIGALVYAALVQFTGRRAINATSVIPFGVFLAPSIWVIWALIQTPYGGLILSSAAQLHTSPI